VELCKHNEQSTSLKHEHQDRIARLEAHIAALTAAAVERESKLQEKAELDYQLLMIHQQLLAEFGDAEPQFREIYERCKPFTMTSIERLYGLYKGVQYIAAAEIPGDLMECGVWRGGSCMLMASTLLALGKPDRRIFMFDTFEGHPAPDPERDVDLWGNRAYEEWRSQTHEGAIKGWGRAPLDEVMDNLQSTGYPRTLLRFVKGMVENTAPCNLPEQLALLRLDTDWYASTRAALAHFYPLLAPGGVLILDDYGHYQGQRQAVDEYFQAIGQYLLFHRIDYSCRVAVKPAMVGPQHGIC
jgi:O-methyltransferase